MKVNPTTKALAAILKSAAVARKAEVEADKRYWAERSARLAAGKAVTFSLKVR